MATPYRSQVSVKSAATVVLTALAIGFGAWVLWRTGAALLLTFAALLIAVALNRVVDWLERRRVPRAAGIAVAMLLLVGVLAGLGFLFIPTAVSQIEQLASEWPKLLASAQRSPAYRFLDRHLDLGAVVGRLKGHAGEVVTPALDVAKAVLDALAAVVTVIFVVLFMLAAGRPIVWGAVAQARPERRAYWAGLVREIYGAIGGYVAGHLLIVAIQAAATSTFLAIVGVPFFLPLGILSGLASLIPFAGVTVVGTLVSLLAWATNSLWTGLGTAIYYVTYQQFENHVLYPMVYRRTVEVNPLVIVLAALFMFDLFGIPGAIVAVPVTAIGHIVVAEVLRRRRERLDIPPAPPTPPPGLRRRERAHT